MLTASLPRRSGRFTYSSPKSPCPVCGRTKDGDCRTTDDGLVLCHTYQDGEPGQVITGTDGQQWAFTKHSDIWGVYAPHREQKAIRPQGTREFIYYDLNGQPVVKVTREDDGRGGKKISQSHWTGTRWQSGGIEVVKDRIHLYRIGEARRLAERTQKPLLLVEGEPCVDALMALGIPATTSLGGAGKWRKYGHVNYAGDLAGLSVVLSPDCDRPGISHMTEVAQDLERNGFLIKGWLLAPPTAPWSDPPKSGGLDVADWISQGATADQIWAAIRQDPPQQDGETNSGTQDVELFAEVEELSQLDQGSGLSLLPEILEAPLKRLAGRMNLPPEAYYLALLCAAASQIGNGTRLELDRGTDYNVPPILWGGIVGETGSRKTPIINAITSPLDAIQADLEQVYRAKLEAYQTELREYEKNKGEAKGDRPIEPKPTDLYVSDFTLEALCQVLGRQPERGLLVGLDELTTFFKSMDAYRNGRGSDRARWLEFYNARALKVDRKTTGRVHVPRTSISLIGGIQPSVIRGLWEQDKTGEDGLWARFAWVRIPITPGPGIQEGATYDLSELLKALYRNLGRLPDKTYRLDRQGIQVWNEWHHEMERQILAEPSDILRASLPKTKDRAARIALVLHLIEAAVEDIRDPDTIIPAATLTKAICFARWLQGQTRLLYGELGETSSPEASQILRFVGRFKGCGPISMKQCRNWWSGRRKPPMSEIRKFVEGVVQMGYARWVDPKHIEVCSHRSHVVTQNPETLTQSASEQATARSHPVVTRSHSVVTSVGSDKSAQLESVEPSLSQPANQNPKSLVAQGLEPVGTLANPSQPSQPLLRPPQEDGCGIREHDGPDPYSGIEASTRNHVSSGWQSWQELDGKANHVKASNGKHSGPSVGKLARFDAEQWEPSSDYDIDPDSWAISPRTGHVRTVSSRCSRSKRPTLHSSSNGHHSPNSAEADIAHLGAHAGIPPWVWET